MINKDGCRMFAWCHDNKVGHLGSPCQKHAMSAKRVELIFPTVVSKGVPCPLLTSVSLPILLFPLFLNMACLAGTAKVSNFIIIRVCNFPGFLFPGKREMQNSMNSREFPGKSRGKWSSREKSVKNSEIPGNSRPGNSREETIWWSGWSSWGFILLHWVCC